MDHHLIQSKKVKRLIKEGRGKGEGKDYTPWTKTYSLEFSSKGRVTRTMGVKTGRIHYLQSDNQYRAFLNFEFSKSVTDIRESYPLLDVYEVVNKLDDLRFDKFQDRETKEPYVLTTNFLLTTLVHGETKLLARTIKNQSELNRKITLEKLEIERRYWQAKNIDWKVITNKQLSKQRAKNLEWLRETLLEDQFQNTKENLADSLLQFLIENRTHPINTILSKFDQIETLNEGTALYLFRFLIASGKVELDLDSPINIKLSFKDMFGMEV
ncbi:TnsA endonuclease N-terminal domain-containing protein [Alkalibacillus haloalkaliphilus]|uniref:TnsA endonuclease N-terminal domain-containing protein n=1 Tax=Alkalibacillus haloalkaliphilus TaxID=94136 RepID=UPI002936781C|nr:TnsA endonuclease N-terminal domain-containing protein [Alkalibacillus haloalkaliphilus]MDV2581681.1 TnsA endonuclease N-terminal domain-containing protein [Alkalibacillus haloalkaliphilus]